MLLLLRGSLALPLLGFLLSGLPFLFPLSSASALWTLAYIQQPTAGRSREQGAGGRGRTGFQPPGRGPKRNRV
jgi:hypothetical protein